MFNFISLNCESIKSQILQSKNYIKLVNVLNDYGKTKRYKCYYFTIILHYTLVLHRTNGECKRLTS